MMPRKKRWFPFCQDFNDDGELWDMTDKFGDRSLRVWMEICSILDKTENHWKMTEDGCKAVFRKARISPATGWRLVGWLLASRWLVTGQSVANERSAIASAPNYWKYHNSAEPEHFPPSILPSFLIKSTEPAPPTLLKKETTEKKKVNAQHEEVFRIAKEIAGSDKERGREICNFVGKTVKEGRQYGDSEEVVNEAILYTLNQLRVKTLNEGKPLDRPLLWPYLQKTYGFKRTKALETESDRYKKEPTQQAGAVLNAIMGKLT